MTATSNPVAADVGHTPTPWTRHTTITGAAHLYGARGKSVARMSGGGKYEAHRLAEAEANAALIVRAVNAHAELIEALKNAKYYIQNLTPNTALDGSRLIQRNIDTAIALAERGA